MTTSPSRGPDADVEQDHVNPIAQSEKDAADLAEKGSLEKQSGARPSYPQWQWILSLVGIYLGALLYGLDTTIAADVQTAVYERFGNIEDLAWVGLGFPMASVAGILFIGRLYGLFNVKTLLNSSILVFEIGSALCGAAPTMNALIIGRVVAGLGGCGMYLGALTFLSALGSPEKLVLYNALIGVCWGTGAILGPVVGGAFSVSTATWRWAFYINLPLAALLMPVYIFVTPSWDPRPELTTREKLKDFDWIGTVLNAAVFVLLIVVIAFAGSTFAWNSAAVITLWVVWAVVLVVFSIQQHFTILTTAEKRLFPVHFLRSKELLLLFVATACAATANAVTLYYIPLFFVFTRGDSALDAAIRLLPFIVVFIFFIMFSGATLPLLGRYSPYYFSGGILIIIGSALMVTVRSDTSIAKVYGYEALIAAGSGACFQNAYAVASAHVGEKDKANAIGFINTAQIGTTAIALAIASCLYQNLGVKFLQDSLQKYGFPRGFLQSALGGAGSTALASAPPEAARLAVDTIAYTISTVYYMALAGGVLLLCVSLVMKHKRINLSESVAGGG